jgi:hypothetical protein
MRAETNTFKNKRGEARLKLIKLNLTGLFRAC